MKPFNAFIFLYDSFIFSPSKAILLIYPCFKLSISFLKLERGEQKKNMKKIFVEICIISARGLSRKSSSLLKPQWFSVGWLEPDNKYCTKIDASGSPNPTWKTKFSISVDQTDTKLERMILTIEVYRREPIFLRERLHGVATVKLQEFLDKYTHDRDKTRSEFEETASFQLRERNSGKPKGFVDVSVRISNKEPGTTFNSGHKI